MSPQTLDLADRRLVAGWAAACAERVLPLFEAESASPVPRDAIARARAFGRGERGAADEIRRRLIAGRAAHDVAGAAAQAAARSAAQAAAVAHMGAHALGAAAYAARAAASGTAEHDAALAAETRWQLQAADPAVREALARLPLLGTDAAGPLARGSLLERGDLGDAIRSLQLALVR